MKISSDGEKSVGGRRAKAAPGRQMMSLRMTPDLRQKITDSAEYGGRSMSQEIEVRLERSFADDNGLGGEKTARFVRHIASCINIAQAESGKIWTEDAATFLVSVHMVMFALNYMRPHEEILDEYFRARRHSRDLIEKWYDQFSEFAIGQDDTLTDGVRASVDEFYDARKSLSEFINESRSIAEVIFWGEAENWDDADRTTREGVAF